MRKDIEPGFEANKINFLFGTPADNRIRTYQKIRVLIESDETESEDHCSHEEEDGRHSERSEGPMDAFVCDEGRINDPDVLIL